MKLTHYSTLMTSNLESLFQCIAELGLWTCQYINPHSRRSISIFFDILSCVCVSDGFFFDLGTVYPEFGFPTQSVLFDSQKESVIYSAHGLLVQL